MTTARRSSCGPEQGARGRGRSSRSPFRTRKRSSSSPSIGGEAKRPGGAERLGLLDVGDRGSTASRSSPSASRTASAPKPHAITTSVIAVAAHPVDHVGDERAIDEGHGGLRPRSGSAAAGGSPRRPPGSGPASARRRDSAALAASGPDRSATRRPAVGASDALVGEAGLAKRSGSRKLRPSMTSGVAIRSRERGPVELGELRPLGDQDRGVGALRARSRPSRRARCSAGAPRSRRLRRPGRSRARSRPRRGAAPRAPGWTPRACRRCPA